MKLTEQTCVPCEGGVAPLTEDEAYELLAQVPDWELSADVKLISRQYSFPDFVGALAFVNKVGELAEADGHHPDIHLTNYKNVTIELTTHAIAGLSQNDFILAAKIDEN